MYLNIMVQWVESYFEFGQDFNPAQFSNNLPTFRTYLIEF